MTGYRTKLGSEELCLLLCCAAATLFVESREGYELRWGFDWIESLPVSGKLDCGSTVQPIGDLRLRFFDRAVHSRYIGRVNNIAVFGTISAFTGGAIHMAIGKAILVSIGNTILMSVGEAICMPIDNLRSIHNLGSVAVYKAKICLGRRQRPCIMIRGQISFLEIMISIIDYNMAVRTADSEGIYRNSAKAIRGPRRWLKRELKPPFCCGNFWVDFFKVNIRRDDSIFEDKNRFDDTNEC